MTGRTVEYYTDILRRVRKGKPPVDESDAYQELLAFDSLYSLSMMRARELAGVEDVDLEIPWQDSMLLDCGKMSRTLAFYMVEDECWNEVAPTIFEGYVIRIIKELAESCTEPDDITGGFAFSEYVRFKELLDYTNTYQKALRNASYGRLRKTWEDILLGNPTVNGGELTDVI